MLYGLAHSLSDRAFDLRKYLYLSYICNIRILKYSSVNVPSMTCRLWHSICYAISNARSARKGSTASGEALETTWTTTNAPLNSSRREKRGNPSRQASALFSVGVVSADARFRGTRAISFRTIRRAAEWGGGRSTRNARPPAYKLWSGVLWI